MKVTIYISGPMTGLPDFNYPAFNRVAAALRGAGFDVVNPAELCHPGMTWQACMRRNVAALMKCDAIVMLPGWEESTGAYIERSIAQGVGIKVFDSIDEALKYEA